MFDAREIIEYPYCGYVIDISLEYVEESIQYYVKKRGLQLEPDFQRTHVWNNVQRSKFIEHVLRGGGKEKPIITNQNDREFVLVDGLQRITAIRMFLANKFRAFGYFYNEYLPNSISPTIGIKFGILKLKTRAEILQWYIDINDGGVIHTDDEINKVREMLKIELEQTEV